MKSISEHLGYIHGMMDGLKLNKDDDTVKIIGMIVDVLDGLNAKVDALEAEQMELNDYVESIDDDLAELEMEHDADGGLHDLNDSEDEDVIHFSSKEPPHKRGKVSFLRDADEADEDFFMDDEEDDDFEDDDVEDAETELYIGCVCPECGKFFSVKNPYLYEDDQKFLCPFCKKKVVLAPMNPENVPTAEPVE